MSLFVQFYKFQIVRTGGPFLGAVKKFYNNLKIFYLEKRPLFQLIRFFEMGKRVRKIA